MLSAAGVGAFQRKEERGKRKVTFVS